MCFHEPLGCLKWCSLSPTEKKWILLLLLLSFCFWFLLFLFFVCVLLKRFQEISLQQTTFCCSRQINRGKTIKIACLPLIKTKYYIKSVHVVNLSHVRLYDSVFNFQNPRLETLRINAVLRDFHSEKQNLLFSDLKNTMITKGYLEMILKWFAIHLVENIN